MIIRKRKNQMSRAQEIEAAKALGKHISPERQLLCLIAVLIMAMLPSLAGMVHYELIPPIVETGLINAEGQDDSLPRWALVYLLPGIFTLCTFICHAQLWIHQRRNSLPPKQIRLLGRWIIPIISLFFCTWAEYSAIGESYSVILCVLGVGLVLLGYALFDCRKGDLLALPFAFAKRSDKIWTRTHRICAIALTLLGLLVLTSVML